MKVLFIENVREPDLEPWYLKCINIPSDVTVDFYNVPEMSLCEAAPGLIKVFFLSFKYDFLVTRQCLYSVLVYSLLFRIFKRKTKLVVDGFQTNEKQQTIRGKIKYIFLRFALLGATKIICYSKQEIYYYLSELKIDKDKFVFMPLPLHYKVPCLAKFDNFVESEGYIISAGRTGRDYETLFKAVDGLDLQVIVVADYFNVKGLDAPKNVEVKYNIPLNELNKLIADSRFGVTSLKDGSISRGQRVCLQYMAESKSQIATDVPGIRDYVIDGKTGYLSPPGNWKDLRHKIEKLWRDPQLRRDMGNNARSKVEKFHDIKVFYSDLFENVFFKLM